MEATAPAKLDIQQITQDILDTLHKDREREIVTRRFGLHGRKETLEEIGQLLGITRERVRQIEKQVVEHLEEIDHPHLDALTERFHAALEHLGHIAPLPEVSEFLQTPHQAHVNFLAHLVPGITAMPENDDFHHNLHLSKHHDRPRLHELNRQLVKTVKDIGEPTDIETIHQRFSAGLDTKHTHGLARASKHLNVMDGKWGLSTWPAVNPKSIRDKIYIVLGRHGKPMHFSEIAEHIKQSDFRRKNVTVQAIHNELIKDSRFVLVGRGIYALGEWGYSRGTVADVITRVLQAEAPLHRDEIIKRVLAERHVKPTTIILNLQGKDRFQRVAKATYALAK